MKTSQIQDLVKLVEESDIDELEVSRWGHKIRITKNKNHVTDTQSQQHYAVPVQTATPSVAQPKDQGNQSNDSGNTSSAGEAESEAALVDTEQMDEVKSPIVGTFYRASDPDAAPYVEVGDRVKPGQTLCIIEAMKILNEIESEVSGVVKEVLVENAEPVEYNQTLFLIGNAD